MGQRTMGYDDTGTPAARAASDLDTWITAAASAAGHGETGTRPLPPSVNYHLWAACNMRCKFCFAPFQDVVSQVLPRGHLPREESIELVTVLAKRFEKISFAGGEPTLCPWLPELVAAAREQGATTMLVTNGSRLEASLDRLAPHLDWVTLSIDSARPRTLVSLGRAVQGRSAIEPGAYARIADAARRAGMRLKVNTVVNALNCDEDLAPLMRTLRPERWKLLRVLPVDGQNSGSVEPLLCSDEQFAAFVARHQPLNGEGIATVPEDNDEMRGSYAMVDPAGRFFDNASGGHRYTAPILRTGVDGAWAQAAFSMPRFEARGGRYDWTGAR